MSQHCLVGIPHRSLVHFKIICLCIFSSIEECDICYIDGAALRQRITGIILTVGLVGLTVFIQHVSCFQCVKAEVRDLRAVIQTLFNDFLRIKNRQMPLTVGNDGLTQHSVIVRGACTAGADIHLNIRAGSIGTVADRNKASTCYVGEGIPVGIGTDRNDVQIAVYQGYAILLDVAGITARDGGDLLCRVNADRISRIYLGRRRVIGFGGIFTGVGGVFAGVGGVFTGGGGVFTGIGGVFTGIGGVFTGLGGRGFRGSLLDGIGGFFGICCGIFTRHKYQQQCHQDCYYCKKLFHLFSLSFFYFIEPSFMGLL